EVLDATERFVPLVALQPVYQHPYAVAKRIATLGAVYGRRVALNLVAGAAVGDLAALGDETAHDERYRRLTEYAQLVLGLRAGRGAAPFAARHYRVRALPLPPALPARLGPELYISGSSEAGRRAGKELGAVPVRYPQPPAAAGPGEDAELRGGGVRLGII